jgi:nucleoside-diphosphate-sugar epimerase
VSTFTHALVTGGAGFIGSTLTRALLNAGHRVTVLDNLSVGRPEQIDPRARFVEGDVRDRTAVGVALAGVDVVYHLAAQVTIRGSFDRFYEDLDTNLMGTATLLREVDPARVRWFVLASSMGVYADAPAPVPISEQHTTEPQSPYGIGKLAAERLAAQVLGLRGIPLTTLRYFNTFGPGQAYTPYVGVLTIFVTKLLSGESLVIFGDGDQRRDFVHVDDIVAGTMAAPGRPPGTYNLGTGKATSLNQLAALAIAHTGSKAMPRYDVARPGELRYSIADITAARTALGYCPRRTLADGLPAIVADIAQRLRTS